LCRIKEGKQKKLFLGNLDAKRDWGHASEYCYAMWKILQQNKPDDYVIATGVQYSIKQFINLTAKKLKINLSWKGKGIKEKAIDEKGSVIIESDKNYFRPLDVNTLLGDASKARKKLKWKPKKNLSLLIDEMIESEYQTLNAIK
jgi:GDPmannose 4,6-dehydratase